MAKSTLSKSSGGALAPWLGISLIVILFDQLTKIAVLKTFVYGVMHQLTPFFNLTLIYNRGAAFGFLATAGGWQRWAFTALGVGATLVICYLLKRHGHQRLFSLSLALILGGALGNVIDRLLYGHVIDFLDFHVGAWHWPAFNLADSAITVGAVLLIYDELRRVRGAR
ncbi:MULTISPECIES: signal peptidase II [Burkholderia]|uniref:Lipoprotein signal peptidase n=1 Tax=Burkholderia mayonis TaxID=1385591 RepID=A0A1B4FC00_9BURK|nr:MULTISPECIES: signal peptidase II [Burkholderia]AOJ01193.1 signal peptidase II [Burkholderia mayonis]KVE44830.1 signal peptidase II [Burkholderia sp. BDU5]KVE49472.1 signal peptidase II [Burkholderia mayonis]